MVGESRGWQECFRSLHITISSRSTRENYYGEIWFKGEDLLKKKPEQMRKIRGNEHYVACHLNMLLQKFLFTGEKLWN